MQAHNATHPPINPAATVILTRQQTEKFQAYLLKRSLQSGFMPGYFVFPGGAVDGQDRHFDLFSNPCNMTGEIPLSPPTLVTLHELLQYTNVNNLQTENHRRPWSRTRLPRLVPLPQGAVIVQPWDPMYPQDKIVIEPASLPAAVLPIGEPFSRIWCDRGIWKPVAHNN